MNKIDIACDWAEKTANDDSHGYDQIHRWLNPDADCSSFVIMAFEQAGFKIRENGGTYTGNMKAAFEKCGFKAIPFGKAGVLLRGDVLLNEKHHTALYIGDNKVVQATSNEKGGIYNGEKGDQTGKEIGISKYYIYRKGWDYILRYNEKEEKSVMIEMHELSMGSMGEEVKTAQRLLNALGYGNLKIDGSFGSCTDAAVVKLQDDLKKKGLIQNIDHIIGKKCWNYLLKGI